MPKIEEHAKRLICLKQIFSEDAKSLSTLRTAKKTKREALKAHVDDIGTRMFDMKPPDPKKPALDDLLSTKRPDAKLLVHYKSVTFAVADMVKFYDNEVGPKFRLFKEFIKVFRKAIDELQSGMKKAKGDEATSLQKLFEAYRDVSKQLQEHMDYVDSKKDNPKFDERKTIQRLRDKAATKFVEFDASLADAEL